ncbi:hypothetical protein [Georgenia satyanarayanai]|uniref:hypothetical protein n=1 Tax=Georgenia satyanarayanai TaxID=860221 RepID=UPI001263F9B8|nr:hypothetical protein [Georgenia satyanarayanai]
MDGDDERSYLRAMLVVTVALGIVTALVAVLVAIVPGGGDEEPAPPGPTSSAPGWTPTDDVLPGSRGAGRSAADGVDRGGEDPR